MAGCAEFVDWLLEAADRARLESARARRHRLARDLVRTFVPELVVCGVDLRTWLAPGARRSRTADPVDDAWDADAFRPALTDGGQGSEALRHLAAGAAVVLTRRQFLIPAANILDWAQGLVRRRRQEARAEICGNRTGAEIGRLLADYLRGGLTRDDLKRRLRTLVCG